MPQPIALDKPLPAASGSLAPTEPTSAGSARGAAAQAKQRVRAAEGFAAQEALLAPGDRPPGPVGATPLPDKVGTVGYYRARHDDYLARHTTPPPPDYYLGYGDKYVLRFTRELRPKLSPEGQAWLDRTFVGLQRMLEERLRSDPVDYDRLEQNSAELKKFAYDTHPSVYLEAGLSELPPEDLARIATTPDLGDLATADGVRQILATGLHLLPEWGERAASDVADGAGRALDWARGRDRS